MSRMSAIKGIADDSLSHSTLFDNKYCTLIPKRDVSLNSILGGRSGVNFISDGSKFSDEFCFGVYS